MSDSPRPAVGAPSLEAKCSRGRVVLSAPEFVEVSPLMRSCIFGFNTHVAELPSSATDVRASTSASETCKTTPAAETAVRRTFLSHLPHDLLKSAWSNGAPGEKGRRAQPGKRETPSGSLVEDAPWWTGGSGAEGGELLPSDLLVRLGALKQEVFLLGDYRDGYLASKPTACGRGRGRQAGRRLPSGLRPDLAGFVGEAGVPDSADTPTALPPSPEADSTDGVIASVGNSCRKRDDGEQDTLMGALCLSLDKLADVSTSSEGPSTSPGGASSSSHISVSTQDETQSRQLMLASGAATHRGFVDAGLGSDEAKSDRSQESSTTSLQLADIALPFEGAPSDKEPQLTNGILLVGANFALPYGPTGSFQLGDIIEPIPGWGLIGERQAAPVGASRSAERLPSDAGGVFAEVQITVLALLEDLHAATCCCAAASSLEPCGCCFGATTLLDQKPESVSSGLAWNATTNEARCGSARDGTGDAPLPGSPSGTRSPSPATCQALPSNGAQPKSPAQSQLPDGKAKVASPGSSASIQSSSSTQNSSVLKVRRPPRTASSMVSRESPSPKSRTSSSNIEISVHADTEVPHENAHQNGDALKSGSSGDETGEKDSPCVVNSRSASVPRNSLRPPAKDGPSPASRRNDDSGNSLHLLFRHHVAVVKCADSFAELMAYAHVFRECVGTYRMPSMLPSPSRHFLVHELRMLRRDPDRLLARNSFQWADAPGAIECLADHPPSLAKGGGSHDGLQSERLQRGDDTGSGMPPQSLNRGYTEAVSPLHEDRHATDSAGGRADSGGRIRSWWPLPLPLLDPTVLLCASGTELAAQKSAVLRILRMLRSLAPSWAARDDNFGFHFTAVIMATSVGAPELQSYRVILQCLSPFDAREWSRDQLLEVLGDLDCIRLTHRRRRNFRASVARMQRLMEHPDWDGVGSALEGTTALARQRWENSSSGARYLGDAGATLWPPRQVVRGGQESYQLQHTLSSPGGSPGPSGAAFLPGQAQPFGATKEQRSVLQQVPPQQVLPSGCGLKGGSRTVTRPGVTDGHADNDADMQAFAAGGVAHLLGGTSPAGSSRRAQSPTGSSVGRRSASSSDNTGSSGGRAGNTSPSDCPMRQQYAVRAAELPKIKGVFIGKKHTCWVAQWNDANGQPRQSCFNIKQHGFEKARRLAVEARQTLMGMSPTKTTSTSSTDRAAAHAVSQAHQVAREAAPTPTNLPDLVFTRDATAAIAEAFGRRSALTPPANMQPTKAKLEGLASGTDGLGGLTGTNAATTALGGTITRGLNAFQARTPTSGNVTLRNFSRGAAQRPALSGFPGDAAAGAAAPHNPEAGATATSTVSTQQLLLQQQLQQQLTEQLQQLQQLQQQFLQQSAAAQQPPLGKQSPVLPEVAPQAPAASSLLGLDGSSSALALVTSLLGGSAAPQPVALTFSDRDNSDAPDAPGAVTDFRSVTVQQQKQTASPGTLGPATETQPPEQGLEISGGATGAGRNSDASAGAFSTLCGQNEALEEDGLGASSKRKHRMLYAQKQGKRTLASLAREFPSVEGITYNVKCACWEVTVKGRETAKVFSTRKFRGLEAAYGAAVMWKRKVDRGEQGADDPDGPEEDEGEDLDDSEGGCGGPSPPGWESTLYENESARKRAACLRPDSSLGVGPVQSAGQVSPSPNGGSAQTQQMLPRSTSL